LHHIEKKSFKVKSKIKIAKFFNILGLSNITKSFRSSDVNNMSENMYKTFKNVVDEDFSEIFKNYNKKTKIFWGKEDKATSLESAHKINKLIKNSEFKVYDGDHYFFLKHSKDIAACIC
jgi:surfactin synthase thioesterase subunit